jgi:hypothetical protein
MKLNKNVPVTKKTYFESCRNINGECNNYLGLRCQEVNGIKNCQ